MGGAWCEHNDYPETCPPCRRAAGVDPSARGAMLSVEQFAAVATGRLQADGDALGSNR